MGFLIRLPVFLFIQLPVLLFIRLPLSLFRFVTRGPLMMVRGIRRMVRLMTWPARRVLT